MSRKLRNILWLFILILGSFPAGYLAVFVDARNLVRSEFLMNIIIAGIACFIVFGVITIIIYAILRDKKKADPAKPALIVHSVLILLFIITYAVQLPGAAKKNRLSDFLQERKEKLEESWASTINARTDLTVEARSNVKNICSCAYYQLESDDELVEEMMADKDLSTFSSRSDKMKKLLDRCTELYQTK